MGLYSGGFIIGRMFESEIRGVDFGKGYFWEGLLSELDGICELRVRRIVPDYLELFVGLVMGYFLHFVLEFGYIVATSMCIKRCNLLKRIASSSERSSEVVSSSRKVIGMYCVILRKFWKTSQAPQRSKLTDTTKCLKL